MSARRECVNCGRRWWGGSSEVNLCDACKDAKLAALEAERDAAIQKVRDAAPIRLPEHMDLAGAVAFMVGAVEGSKTRLEAAETLLREVRDRFREYEAIHRQKGTPDGDAKAARNAEMADKIETFLDGSKP